MKQMIYSSLFYGVIAFIVFFGVSFLADFAAAKAAETTAATVLDQAAPACSQPAALAIAASFGITTGSVEAVDAGRIVVHGKMNGQRVELILRDGQAACAVQRMSYI